MEVLRKGIRKKGGGREQKRIRVSFALKKETQKSKKKK